MAEKYIIKKFRNRKIKYCIGRIFSTANKDQKKNYLIPDLKNRISKSKKKIELKNLNHYRDFISMHDISNIIFKLLKKKYHGILNIANGKKIHLKIIAKIILNKYRKKNYFFNDNSKETYLVGNIKKLKSMCKYKPKSNIKDLIF